MELFLEPAVTKFDAESIRADSPGGRSADEWNGAYEKVECYFRALRIHNNLLRGQLVVHVLNRAMQLAPEHPSSSASELALGEMDHVVNEWFAAVLDVPAGETAEMLSTRGRLALLLADMPVKWQDQFLRPSPWPEDFVAAMRDAYLRAGPDFQVSKMAPRPLDLGPIATLTNLSHWAGFKYVALGIWIALGALVLALFQLAH